MSTETLTLTSFLLARIAEDEHDQRSGSGRHYGAGEEWHRLDCWLNDRDAQPCDCGVPARMLAECEAKRRIVDAVGRCTHREGWSVRDCDGCSLLALLALPYADHPDYRDEWKP